MMTCLSIQKDTEKFFMRKIIKMKAKHIRFYQNFHKAFQDKKSNHCSNLISDGGVIQNRELKRINYEKTFKSNKQFELNSKNMPSDFYIDSIILGHN